MRALLVIACLLLGAAMFAMPYGFYTLLRLWLCVVGGLLCYRWVARSLPAWVGVGGLLCAVLYNPLVPVYLSRDIWLWINIVSLVFMLVVVLSRTSLSQCGQVSEAVGDSDKACGDGGESISCPDAQAGDGKLRSEQDCSACVLGVPTEHNEDEDDKNCWGITFTLAPPYEEIDEYNSPPSFAARLRKARLEAQINRGEGSGDA